jgi:hypothetical protein
MSGSSLLVTFNALRARNSADLNWASEPAAASALDRPAAGQVGLAA